VTELAGFLWLACGVGGLLTSAGLVGLCIGLRSWVDFVLATYVIAWAWLVAVALALSPFELLTRASLGLGVVLGLAAALCGWVLCGRPTQSHHRAALETAKAVLRNRAVLVLAVAVGIGFVYSVAVALFIPANDWDALTYHLSRAALWKQEHGLGYVPNAVDIRLNANPPIAETGQLATMLLSGGDRYIALAQLGAYVVIVLSVARLARLLGLRVDEAALGALAFATLPVVLIQSSGALNDLVVASFLVVSAVFGLQASRRSLALGAVAVGLALGTKFTAVFALPTLALVVAVARPRRQWPQLALAGIAGLALGSAWYLVNLAQTGRLDGGLGDQDDQRTEFGAATVVAVLRFSLDFIDMSGAPDVYGGVFLVVAVGIAVSALYGVRRTGFRPELLLAAALTAGVVLVPRLYVVAHRIVFEIWVALGRPFVEVFERGFDRGVNLEADSTLSWYGPLGTLLVAVGSIGALVLWRRRSLSTLGLTLALAPWLYLVTLALTIVWDPWRGRFLVFGVALAAATWGFVLRSRSLRIATVAVGAATLGLCLVNYQGKPLGQGELLGLSDPRGAPVRSVWGASRSEAQLRLRGGEARIVYDYLAERAGDERIAVAAGIDDFLYPFFGSRLSRHVDLVPRGGAASAEAVWLVRTPSRHVRRCPQAWRTELDLASGWRVERRIRPDTCVE
jgi:hypothetical protein